MALKARRPESGLLHHSDRGSQYASRDYREMLKEAGCVCSMSRKGNCWDNAPVESFFATLKRELVHDRRFQTREQAKSEIFEFIEVWYNRQRRHSALNYLSPADYEKKMITESQAIAAESTVHDYGGNPIGVLPPQPHRQPQQRVNDLLQPRPRHHRPHLGGRRTFSRRTRARQLYRFLDRENPASF